MESSILKDFWPDWHIIKEIGRGSYGIVYEAHNSITDSHSAIKVIRIPSDQAEVDSLKQEGMTEEETAVFLEDIVNNSINEIKLMESFKGNNNFVSVEDFKIQKDPDKPAWTIYIRMELLTPVIMYFKDREIREEEVVKLGIHICSALECCEQLKIIHRDIKPENLFLNTRWGNFKLGDFGIARNLDNMTRSLTVAGAMNYMAPEVENGKEYDHRADIYSLGLVLYRLMNDNRLPFIETKEQMLSAKMRTNALIRRLHGEPLPPPCNASLEFANIILTACAPEPDGRFFSASEMKKELLRIEDTDITIKVNRSKKKEDENSTIRVRPPEDVIDKNGEVNSNTAVTKKREFKFLKESGKRNLILLIIGLCAIIVAIAISIVLFKPASDKEKEEGAQNPTESSIISDHINEADQTESSTENTDQSAQIMARGQEAESTTENAVTEEPEMTEPPILTEEPEVTEPPTLTEKPIATVVPQTIESPETEEKTDIAPETAEEADIDEIFYITGNAKNIRSGPGYSYDLAGKIEDSSLPLHYYGESAYGIAKDKKEHLWYHVYMEDGIDGWIISDHLSIIPGQIDVTTLGDVVYIKGNAKVIRSGPTYNSDFVVKLTDSKEPLKFLGETGYGIGKDKEQHLWIRVYRADGTAGWIQSNLISNQPGQ